ncbi:unnamed protein product [Schistosoma turkestanicum]|nr:unnamed protein product [Schistosoma turkestanicum]
MLEAGWICHTSGNVKHAFIYGTYFYTLLIPDIKQLTTTTTTTTTSNTTNNNTTNTTTNNTQNENSLNLSTLDINNELNTHSAPVTPIQLNPSTTNYANSLSINTSQSIAGLSSSSSSSSAFPLTTNTTTTTMTTTTSTHTPLTSLNTSCLVTSSTNTATTSITTSCLCTPTNELNNLSAFNTITTTTTTTTATTPTTNDNNSNNNNNHDNGSTSTTTNTTQMSSSTNMIVSTIPVTSFNFTNIITTTTASTTSTTTTTTTTNTTATTSTSTSNSNNTSSSTPTNTTITTASQLSTTTTTTTTIKQNEFHCKLMHFFKTLSNVDFNLLSQLPMRFPKDYLPKLLNDPMKWTSVFQNEWAEVSIVHYGANAECQWKALHHLQQQHQQQQQSHHQQTIDNYDLLNETGSTPNVFSCCAAASSTMSTSATATTITITANNESCPSLSTSEEVHFDGKNELNSFFKDGLLTYSSITALFGIPDKTGFQEIDQILRKSCLCDLDGPNHDGPVEWAHCVYDANYHPTCAFSIELQWLVVTGGRMAELISLWYQKAGTANLHFFPAPCYPFGQPDDDLSDKDPLRKPIFLPININVLINVAQKFYQQFKNENNNDHTDENQNNVNSCMHMKDLLNYLFPVNPQMLVELSHFFLKNKLLFDWYVDATAADEYSNHVVTFFLFISSK